MNSRFFYVYILESGSVRPHYYVGFTENLKGRLKHHNSGGDPHSAKYRPWRIKTAVAFTDRDQALA
jgi:putative endonuclease